MDGRLKIRRLKLKWSYLQQSIIINFFTNIKLLITSKRRIYLLPVLGLCNRMRSIDSAIALAEEFNFELVVFWVNNRDCKAAFHELFQHSSHFKVIEIDATNSVLKKDLFLFARIENMLISISIRIKLFLINSKKYDYILSFEKQMMLSRKIKAANPKIQLWDFDTLFMKKLSISTEISSLDSRVFITSCHRFFSNKHNFKAFIPVDKLHEEIFKQSKKFNETIGLHIRRTDMVKMKNEESINAFIKIVEQEISMNKAVTFFLSTDCPNAKNIFITKFPNRIYYVQHDSLNRDQNKGMKAAIIDLYCLSKTKKIYGTYFSTFSLTASEIGNIELIVND